MWSGAMGKTARVNRPGSSTATQGRSPVGVKMNTPSFGRWVITPRSPVTESRNNICAEPGGVGCGVVIPTGNEPSCIARHRNGAAGSGNGPPAARVDELAAVRRLLSERFGVDAGLDLQWTGLHAKPVHGDQDGDLGSYVGP